MNDRIPKQSTLRGVRLHNNACRIGSIPVRASAVADTGFGLYPAVLPVVSLAARCGEEFADRRFGQAYGCLSAVNESAHSQEVQMRSRLLNRNTILGFLVAVVMVVLFNSGVIAHGTASIKALLTGDSPAASAPATQELPDAPRE